MSDGATPAPASIEPPDTRPPSPSDSSHPSWLIPALAGIVYLVYWQIVPRIHSSSAGALLFSTVVSLGILIWFTASAARSIPSGRAAAQQALLLAIIVIPTRILLGRGHPVALILNHYIPGLPDLLFFWFAAALGVLLSFLVRGANMIPPIAAVLALVDVWTVLLGGPVYNVMHSASATAKAITTAMTAQLPTPQAGASPMPAMAVIGFADGLFIAFFIAALCRFVQRPDTYRRTLYALIGVLGFYIVIVMLPSVDLSLPALPPMAIVVIALNWRHFHYNRSELFALLYAGLFIALIAVIFWFFGRTKSETDVPQGAWLSPPAGRTAFTCPPRAPLPQRRA